LAASIKQPELAPRCAALGLGRARLRRTPESSAVAKLPTLKLAVATAGEGERKRQAVRTGVEQHQNETGAGRSFPATQFNILARKIFKPVWLNGTSAKIRVICANKRRAYKICACWQTEMAYGTPSLSQVNIKRHWEKQHARRRNQNMNIPGWRAGFARSTYLFNKLFRKKNDWTSYEHFDDLILNTLTTFMGDCACAGICRKILVV
jgi:hypothetical protein